MHYELLILSLLMPVFICLSKNSWDYICASKSQTIRAVIDNFYVSLAQKKNLMKRNQEKITSGTEGTEFHNQCIVTEDKCLKHSMYIKMDSVIPDAKIKMSHELPWLESAENRDNLNGSSKHLVDSGPPLVIAAVNHIVYVSAAANAAKCVILHHHFTMTLNTDRSSVWRLFFTL